MHLQANRTSVRATDLKKSTNCPTPTHHSRELKNLEWELDGYTSETEFMEVCMMGDSSTPSEWDKDEFGNKRPDWCPSPAAYCKIRDFGNGCGNAFGRKWWFFPRRMYKVKVMSDCPTILFVRFVARETHFSPAAVVFLRRYLCSR